MASCTFEFVNPNNIVAGSNTGVTVYYFDHDGNAVTPDSANYTLMDSEGSIVNEKVNEPITGLSTSSFIFLSGDDLKSGYSKLTQYIIIEAVYDTDKPIRDFAKFTVLDLVFN